MLLLSNKLKINYCVQCQSLTNRKPTSTHDHVPDLSSVIKEGPTVANKLMVQSVRQKVIMSLENEDCFRHFFCHAIARDNESSLTSKRISCMP